MKQREWTHWEVTPEGGSQWDIWAACLGLDIQVRAALTPLYISAPWTWKWPRAWCYLSDLILFSHVFIIFIKSLSPVCCFLTLLKITVPYEWISSPIHKLLSLCWPPHHAIQVTFSNLQSGLCHPERSCINSMNPLSKHSQVTPAPGPLGQLMPPAPPLLSWGKWI